MWQIKELLEGCESLFPNASFATASVVGVSQKGLVLTSLDKVSEYVVGTIKMLCKL